SASARHRAGGAAAACENGEAHWFRLPPVLLARGRSPQGRLPALKCKTVSALSHRAGGKPCHVPQRSFDLSAPDNQMSADTTINATYPGFGGARTHGMTVSEYPLVCVNDFTHSKDDRNERTAHWPRGDHHGRGTRQRDRLCDGKALH